MMPLLGSWLLNFSIFTGLVLVSFSAGLSIGSTSAVDTPETLSENLKVLSFSFFKSSFAQPLTGQNFSISQERGWICLSHLLLKKRSRAYFLAFSWSLPE